MSQDNLEVLSNCQLLLAFALKEDVSSWLKIGSETHISPGHTALQLGLTWTGQSVYTQKQQDRDRPGEMGGVSEIPVAPSPVPQFLHVEKSLWHDCFLASTFPKPSMAAASGREASRKDLGTQSQDLRLLKLTKVTPQRQMEAFLGDCHHGLPSLPSVNSSFHVS